MFHYYYYLDFTNQTNQHSRQTLVYFSHDTYECIVHIHTYTKQQITSSYMQKSLSYYRFCISHATWLLYICSYILLLHDGETLPRIWYDKVSIWKVFLLLFFLVIAYLFCHTFCWRLHVMTHTYVLVWCTNKICERK